MRRGSRGATVKSAQQKLKTLVPLTTDGRYTVPARGKRFWASGSMTWKPDGMLGPRNLEQPFCSVTTKKA